MGSRENWRGARPVIAGQQNIVWLYVAMNDSLAVSVSERFGDLLKIIDRIVEADRLFSTERPEVSAGHVLEHDVVKRHSFKIGGGSVPEPLNDVWMTNAIEGNRFVLKVLNQRVLELRIGSSLKRGVERFDNRRPAFVLLIVREEYLGVAAASQAAIYQVSVINQTVFES